MEKYTVYKTTCLVNNKIYIGVHKTLKENDSYLGSGTAFKNAESKYGKDSFNKEIIKIFETKQEAYDLEAKLVTKEFIKLDTNYNLKPGGEGGWDYINETRINVNSSPETSLKISESQKQRYKNGVIPWNKGKKLPGSGLKSKESRLKNGNSFKGENNPMHGKSVKDFMSEEAIIEWGNKISEANKGKIRSDKAKENYSKAAKSRKWLIHISGKKSSTTDENDPRLSQPEWQLGRKWKTYE